MKFYTTITKYILLLLFSLVYLNLIAQTDKYTIGITTGAFIPEISKFENGKLISDDEKTFNSKYFKLIQFYNIPSDEQKKQWQQQGLQLTDYLPGNAYFSVIDTKFNLLKIANEIRAIIPIDKRFKLEENIYKNGIPNYAIKNGKAQLIINYFPELNIEDIKTVLAENKIDVLSVDETVKQINISIIPTQLNELVALPFIQYIDAIYPEPNLEGQDYRNSSGRSNYLNKGYSSLNYNADGVTIAVGESGALIDEIDAKGRIGLELESGYSDHKVGVMENIGGAGNWDPTNQNQAWSGTILSTPSTPNYASLYSSNNLLYTNHSYGYGVSGGYNTAARNHDLLLATIPQYEVIFSAGNDGVEIGYAPYNIANWGNITGAVKMSKHVLTVGALLPNDIQPAFSSRGPMYDGRIAPQVVIEGGGGTSFAAPKTTGIFAMLCQTYKAQHSGTVPPSSLLRAIVFNTADDVDNPGPDFKTGFGRINVRRAYNIMTNNQFLNATVSNGNTNSHTITIPPNTKKVKVMIVWPDVAAAINANPAIVNNLNLQLKDPNNITYNPWVLDVSLPTSDTKLNAPAVRGIDNLNTIEQVTVDNPVAGNWTIEVNGFNVPSGPQTYFISYEFLKDDIQMIFPLKNDRLVSTETYQLKWDSDASNGTFLLEYQIAGGAWIKIEDGIDSLTRNFTWIAPSVSGIQPIKFRVTKGSLVSESDTCYIGQEIENFRITKVCNDTVTLRWSPLAGATAYKVYRLGIKYMEEVTANITYYGNSAILTGQSNIVSEYYAVSALTGANEGRRTYTIEKPVGDLNCVGIYWTGIVSTDWFNPSNWATSTVPTPTDNVIIPSAPSNQPIINNIGAVCGNITIDAGALLTMSSTNSYNLSVYGDWINNGTFNRGIDTVEFVATNNYQEISGNSITDFHVLRVAKGNIDRIVDATAIITLKATTNPLLIESGTFKLSSASTITPFTTSSGADLVSDEGFWNNGGTVNTGNYSWYNGGKIRLTAGTINRGTNTNNHLYIWNNGILIMEGGTLNVAGSLRGYSGVSSGSYYQYGGIVTVNTVGSTATDKAPFDLNDKMTFVMTGGTIIVRRASSCTLDYWNKSTNATVQGGTLQIGNTATPTSQTIRVYSNPPLYNLTVNTTNNPTARIDSNDIIIKNNLLINGGTLNANGYNINIQGNWTNNSNFIASTGNVTFNGSNEQYIAGSNATTFSNLIINNKNGIKLNGLVNANISTSLSLLNGVITTNNNILIMNTGSSVSRTNGHIFGKLQKSIVVGSNVNTNFEIGDASIGKYTPINLSFNTVSNAGTITASTTNTDHAGISSTLLDASNSVNRNYTLTNNSIVFDKYNAIFNFLSSDLDVSTDWNSLVCGKLSSGTWTYPTIGTKTSTSTEIIDVTSFSDFQLAEYVSVLPIELFSFNVTLDKKNQVQIDWATASEINNDYFIVEKSADGINWSVLKTVAGQGNSTQINYYNIIDENPEIGNNYYRIKQIDFDGTFTFSEIKMIKIENKKSISIYPNPANRTIYISNITQNNIQIFSAIGQNVTNNVHIKNNNNNYEIDISLLNDGIYFIKTLSETFKIIKKSF